MEVRVTVPDTHREAEVRVHTTVYSVPDLVLPQHRLSWTRIMQHDRHDQWKDKTRSLGEVAGRLKTVDPDCQMIKEAKRIGISFGD